MDEQTLQVFLTLSDTENTRDAAALLRVNQSNVSRALARLEGELGGRALHSARTAPRTQPGGRGVPGRRLSRCSRGSNAAGGTFAS